MLLLLTSLVEFLRYFIFEKGLEAANLPVVGPDQSLILGTCIFTYSFVCTMPSWANEKKPEVSFNVGIWGPTFLGLLLKLLFGIFGALAFTTYAHENALDVILSDNSTPSITRVASYIYAIGTILPGIPPVSITLRYGLYTEGTCGKNWAFVWGVVFPWAVGLFLSHEESITVLMNWSALFASSFTDFIFPIFLWLKALDVA